MKTLTEQLEKQHQIEDKLENSHIIDLFNEYQLPSNEIDGL